MTAGDVLYDRDTLLAFVKDALHRARDPQAPPVLLLTGPPGAGKTALLERLEQLHRGWTPVIRFDFLTTPPAPSVNLASFMVSASGALQRKVHFIGKIALPRVALGLTALSITASDDNDFRTRLNEVLGTRRSAAARLVNDLAAGLASLFGGPAGQVAASELGTLLGWLLDAVSQHRLHDLLRSYADITAAPDIAGYQPLLRLREWSRHPQSRDLWLAMSGAFMADLAAHYRSGPRRVTNCLMLLDNVDVGAGLMLLQGVLDYRLRPRDNPDAALVVATARGKPTLRPAAIPVVTDLGYPAVNNQRYRQDRCYQVSLTRLDIGAARSLIRSDWLGHSSADSGFAFEVSAGNPLALSELGSALTRAGGHADLMATPWCPDRCAEPTCGHSATGETVEARLLSVVLRSAHAGDDVPALGASDMKLAAAFAVTVSPGPDPAVRKAIAGALDLRPGEGQDDCADRLVRLGCASKLARGVLHVDTLPRLLLTRWLADSGNWGPPPRQDLWQEVHDGYVSVYRSSDECAVAYHQLAAVVSLASPYLRQVVTCLHQFLFPSPPERPDVPAREADPGWHDKLARVTAAPSRLRQADADRVAAGDSEQFGHDPRTVALDLVNSVRWQNPEQAAIALVVVIRWLHSDRLFDPRHLLASLAARAYDDLAQLVPSGMTGLRDLLFEQAETFRATSSD